MKGKKNPNTRPNKKEMTNSKGEKTHPLKSKPMSGALLF
jgi:hypothetical protein